MEYSRTWCEPCAAKAASDTKAAAAEQAAEEKRQKAAKEAAVDAKLKCALHALDAAGRPGLVAPRLLMGYEKYGLLKRKKRPIYRESTPTYPVGKHRWRYKHRDAEGTLYEFAHDFATGILPSGKIVITKESPGGGAELDFGQREYVVNSLVALAKRHGVVVT